MSNSAMMDYLTTDNPTDIGLLKAQLEHMGGALGREIELCAKADAECERLRTELLNARIASEQLATEVYSLKALLLLCREHVTPELVNAIDDAT